MQCNLVACYYSVVWATKKRIFMNLSQRQELFNIIQDFDNMNYDSYLAAKYKNQGPLDAIIFGDYSVPEALSLAKKVFRQLNFRLNAEDWQILPLAQNMPEYGPINIGHSLRIIVASLSKGDVGSAIFHIKAMAFYQMSYGFWNTPKKLELGIRESSLQKLEERANLVSETASKKYEDSEQLIKALEKKQHEIKQWFEKTSQEFQVLKNNQAESNTIITNIRNTEKNANTLSSSIETSKQKADESVRLLSTNSQKISDQISDSNALIDQANRELENINRISAESLDGVKKNLDETNKDVADIKKMMGYIADGTLSHSFNKRKKDIDYKAKIWLVVSAVAFFAAIAWIFIVFKWLSADTGIVWANILINAVKSSLAVFAFGYALNEYGKERNLQEEYAFRESVALTLSAYLSKLETCDKDEMKKLLVDTVGKLYAKPVISNKEYKFMKMNTEEIADNLKPIVDMIRPVADAVKPVVDKVKD